MYTAPLNIICFRFNKAGHNDSVLNRVNATVRDRIIKKGSFYIVQVELEGRLYIRLTIINPATSINDLKELLISIKKKALEELKIKD